MKNKELSLPSLKDLGPKFGSFFHRYGLLLFFLAIAASLITAVIVLNNIILQTDNPDGYVSGVNDASFDTQTIENIRNLRSENESTKKITASGDRLLPF